MLWRIDRNYTEVMQIFHFFSCFSCAYIFNIMPIQGVDISLISDHVSAYNETNDMTARQMFKEFVKTHNRTYVNDPVEYGRRLSVFKESLARHIKLNVREREQKGTALYGINQFSDWTPQEFKEFLRRGSRRDEGLLTKSIQSPEPVCKFCNLNLNASATPHSQDWNKKGKVTAVKNQGKCGSCWAFTATECVESQWAIADNTLTELSVQELISCSRAKGCSGGNTYEALLWLQNMFMTMWKKQILALGYQNPKQKLENYTLATASDFPYVDKESSCKKNLLTERGAKIKCGCLLNMVNKTEVTGMKPLVGLHGPLAVNVDATMWHDYLGGIIQHHCTDTDINHAVQITGYDFNGHIWYWIVRNSWGSSFGENGYLYIKMGDNLCGVANSPSFVVI